MKVIIIIIMPVYKREETSHKKNSVDEWNKANKPIIISDDKDKTTEYLCKYCNCVIKGKFTPDSIFCVHCQSEIYLDKDTHSSQSRPITH